MTIWLAGGSGARAGALALTAEPGASRGPDLIAYRMAVTELVSSFESSGAQTSSRLAARILSPGVTAPEMTAVLNHTPRGTAGALERLLSEVRHYRPSSRGSAASLASLLRISLLAQIDALWWGREPAYPTDADVRSAGELLDLDALQQGGLLRFQYRHQTSSFLRRAARLVERRALPRRRPRTAGLQIAVARPQTVALLNQLATRFAELAPPGTPPLFVTSLTRSVEHQQHLHTMGYAALLPSSHCVGYAADVEMAWFRRFRAQRPLREVLLDRQDAGEINVIDEGQAWHICVRPGVSFGSRLLPAPSACDRPLIRPVS